MKKHSEEIKCRGSDCINDRYPGSIITCDDCVNAAVALDEMLVNLEVEFRRDLNPQKILTKVMRLTCEFYGGNWCGALDIKADVDTWTPVWWYDAETGGMTETEFFEYETVRQFPQWAKALEEERTLCIHNMDEVRKNCPEELDHYERLSVSSVIAAPYYKGSTGFLVIRNPTKYVDNPDCLKLMAYVVSCELNDYRLIKNCSHQMISDLIQNPDDVVINLFGGLEIYTAHGMMKAEDIEKKQIAKVIEFLALNPKRPHSAREMGGAFYGNLEDVDDFTGNLKHYIYRFRSTYGDLFPEDNLIINTNAGMRDRLLGRSLCCASISATVFFEKALDFLLVGFQPKEADAWVMSKVYLLKNAI